MIFLNFPVFLLISGKRGQKYLKILLNKNVDNVSLYKNSNAIDLPEQLYV